MKNLFQFAILFLLLVTSISTLSIATKDKDEFTTRVEYPLPEDVMVIRSFSAENAANVIIEYADKGYVLKAMTSFIDKGETTKTGTLIVMEKRVEYVE